MQHKTEHHGFHVGDLVIMKRGYSVPGVVTVITTLGSKGKYYARIYWSDDGFSVEALANVKKV